MRDKRNQIKWLLLNLEIFEGRKLLSYLYFPTTLSGQFHTFLRISLRSHAISLRTHRMWGKLVK